MTFRLACQIAVIATALLPFMPLEARAADRIGTVLEVEGAATISHIGGERLDAQLDAPVNMDDIIETGPGAKLFVQFIDGTEITISENTKLMIDEYVFDPDSKAGNKAEYSILRGTFLYTSGLVAKSPKPDVKVNTAYGVIGIRGTQFWGGPIDEAYGVLVNDGAVTIRNSAGQVSLDKGQGSTLKNFREAPGPVQVWKQQKIERAVATVTLKNAGLLKDKIARRSKLNREIAKARVLKQKGGRIIDRKLQQRPDMQKNWKRPRQ